MSDTPSLAATGGNITGTTPVMPFEQLRDTGLLWLINTTVFHPRGYAMSIDLDPETGAARGFQIIGDGKNRWTYHESLTAELDAKFQTIRRLLP